MPRMIFRKLLRLLPTNFRRVRVVRRRRVGALHGSRKQYLLNKENARILVHKKLISHNEHYGLVFNKVAIRNQQSRWGSCSKKGNLNFNYRIVLLPESLQDYLIVHELCHLAMFNHSKQFWALVGEVIPDHVARRRELMHYTKEHYRQSATLD